MYGKSGDFDAIIWRCDADEAVVAQVELGRHHQLYGGKVLLDLGQGQCQRSRVVDVLDLQLLLEVVARGIDVDDQADAEGRCHDQGNG